MVPAILVVSVVVGGFSRRAWWLVPIAAVVWPALLLATEVVEFDLAVVGAAVVGTVNAAFGVLLGRLLRSVPGRSASGGGLGAAR